MKKAISPLISSIALLGFAVILGLIVISWGNVYSGEFQKISCDSASINVLSVANTLKLCSRQESLFFSVENDGGNVISGVLVNVIGTYGIQQVSASVTLGIAEIKGIEVPFSTALVGNIQKIKIVPSILFKDSEYLCPKKGFEVEQIVACNE